MDYKYKTISIKHLDELQEDIDKLRREGKLSDNKTFRGYIDTKKFEVPESIPDAKSIIILAINCKLTLVNFHLDNKKYEVVIPPNYCDDGTTFEDFEHIIFNEIIKESGYSIEYTNKLHTKLLAVRSGLGKYGRNNICYVGDWGTMVYLIAYFTNYHFEDDNWNNIEMMEKCEYCTICIKNCPTAAIPSISDENFVIDAGSCISVYNEIEGIIPSWIPSDAHNALMGCMRCQKSCPANHEAIKNKVRFEDISENETKAILEGQIDDKTADSLSKKLKMFSPSDAQRCIPVLKRNLEILIK